MRQNPIHLISVNINKLNVSWICLWVLSVVWRFSGNRNKKKRSHVRQIRNAIKSFAFCLFVCLLFCSLSCCVSVTSRIRGYNFFSLTHSLYAFGLNVCRSLLCKRFFLPIFCALWAVTLWQVAKCTILLCFYVILLFVVGRFFSRVSESCFAWFFWRAFLPLCTYRRAIMLSWNCVLNCINPNHLRG